MSEFLSESDNIAKRKSINFGETETLKRPKLSSSSPSAPSSKLAAPKLLLRPSAFGSSSQDKTLSNPFDSNNKDKGPSNQNNAKIKQLFGSSERGSIAPSHLFAKPAPNKEHGPNNSFNIFQPPPSNPISNLSGENKSSVTSKQKEIKKSGLINENKFKDASKPSKNVFGLTSEVKTSVASKENEPKTLTNTASPLNINRDVSTLAKKNLSSVAIQPNQNQHPPALTKTNSNILPNSGSKVTTNENKSIGASTELKNPEPTVSKEQVAQATGRSNSRKSKAPRKNVTATVSLSQSSTKEESTTPKSTEESPNNFATELTSRPTERTGPSGSTGSEATQSTNALNVNPSLSAINPKPTSTVLNSNAIKPKPINNSLVTNPASNVPNPKPTSNVFKSNVPNQKPVPNAPDIKPTHIEPSPKLISNELKSKSASNAQSLKPSSNVLNPKSSSNELNPKPTSNLPNPKPSSNDLSPHLTVHTKNGASNVQNQRTPNVLISKPTMNESNTPVVSNATSRVLNSNPLPTEPNQNVTSKPRPIVSEPKLTLNELTDTPKANQQMNDNEQTSLPVNSEKINEAVIKSDTHDGIQRLQTQLNQEIVSDKNEIDPKETKINGNLDDSNVTKKRFDCDQCPKSYQRPAGLTNHKKVHSGETSSEIKNTEKKKSVRKATNCGDCNNCKNQIDCGNCKNCLDKPKFGGPSKIRRKCVDKVCSNPKKVVATNDGSSQETAKTPELNNSMRNNSFFDDSMELDSSMDAYIDDFKDVDFGDIPLQLQESSTEPELNSLFENIGESSVLDPFQSKKAEEDLDSSLLDSSMDSLIDDFLNGSSNLSSDLDTSLDSLMGDVLDDNLEADTFESFNETLSNTGSDTFDNQKQKRRRKNVNCKICKNCKRSKDCGKCENCVYKDKMKNENEGEKVKSRKYKCLQKVCLNLIKNEEESGQKEASREDMAAHNLEQNVRNTLDLVTEVKRKETKLGETSQMEDDEEELFELFLDVVDLSGANSNMAKDVKVIASYENPQINNLGEILNVVKIQNEDQREVVFDVDEESYILKKQKGVVYDVDEDNFILNSSF